MAVYTIAPAATGSYSMGAAAYGLRNGVDYNVANKTSTLTSLNTLVTSPVTYNSALTYKTWESTNPLQFSHMFGESWGDDVLTFSAQKTGVGNIITGQKVDAYTSETDPGNNFNITNGEYLVPIAGTYTITANFDIIMTGANTTVIDLEIMKNTITQLAIDSTSGGGSQTASLSITAALAVGDVLFIRLKNNSTDPVATGTVQFAVTNFTP